MTRLLITLALASGLCGCVVVPAPYGYAYAPGYYAAPSIGIGVGGYYGWHGH